MRPGNPPPRKRGNLRRDWRKVAWGGRGANRANRANPAPTDPAPAHQATFQVTYGVGRGANRGGGGATRRSVS